MPAAMPAARPAHHQTRRVTARRPGPARAATGSNAARHRGHAAPSLTPGGRDDAHIACHHCTPHADSPDHVPAPAPVPRLSAAAVRCRARQPSWRCCWQAPPASLPSKARSTAPRQGSRTTGAVSCRALNCARCVGAQAAGAGGRDAVMSTWGPARTPLQPRSLLFAFAAVLWESFMPTATSISIAVPAATWAALSSLVAIGAHQVRGASAQRGLPAALLTHPSRWLDGLLPELCSGWAA
jgi:hypothetical protein